MKKIFTLLVCLAGMAISANAADLTTVYQCIHAVLSHNGNTMMKANPDLDANHDGVLNIADVTRLISQALQAELAEQANRAPARDEDIEELIHQVLVTKDAPPTIHDVTNAINQKLQNE